MKKYVNCYYCGKRIYENEMAVQQRYHTQFYCSCRCFASDTNLCCIITLNDELLKEDNLSWDGGCVDE